MPAHHAIEELARRLYETMDKLDPVECPAWGALEEENREFYRACVRDLLQEKRLIQEALGVPTTTQ